MCLRYQTPTKIIAIVSWPGQKCSLKQLLIAIHEYRFHRLGLKNWYQLSGFGTGSGYPVHATNHYLMVTHSSNLAVAY